MICSSSQLTNTCPIDRKAFAAIVVRNASDARVMREVAVEDKSRPAAGAEYEETELTYCEVCGECSREDRMLLCDRCDHGYHCECLNPPLEFIPIDDWFCPVCTRRMRDEARRAAIMAIPASSSSSSSSASRLQAQTSDKTAVKRKKSSKSGVKRKKPVKRRRKYKRFRAKSALRSKLPTASNRLARFAATQLVGGARARLASAIVKSEPRAAATSGSSSALKTEKREPTEYKATTTTKKRVVRRRRKVKRRRRKTTKSKKRGAAGVKRLLAKATAGAFKLKTLKRLVSSTSTKRSILNKIEAVAKSKAETAAAAAVPPSVSFGRLSPIHSLETT